MGLYRQIFLDGTSPVGLVRDFADDNTWGKSPQIITFGVHGSSTHFAELQ